MAFTAHIHKVWMQMKTSDKSDGCLKEAFVLMHSVPKSPELIMTQLIHLSTLPLFHASINSASRNLHMDQLMRYWFL